MIVRHRIIGRVRRVAGFVLMLAIASGCSASKHLKLRDLLELEAALSRPVPSKEPVAVPTTQPSRPVLAQSPYRLTPGDYVRLSILGMSERDETTPSVFDLRVSRAGTIRIPYNGDLEVAGKELDEAEAFIRESLVSGDFFAEEMYKLVVTIEVLKYATTSVFVVGAVAVRGLIELRENERTVVAAVNAATLSESASGVVHVRSNRGRDSDASYDLRDPAGLRRALTAPPLESGDVVLAETATPNVVYFTGLLTSSGPVVFDTGQRVTFLQALASAGGRDPMTDPEMGLLRRRLPTGDEVLVELALKDIEMGKEPNFEMRPGDIVNVPQTFQTLMTGWLNQNLQFTTGASAHVRYDPLVERRADQLNRRGVQDSGGIDVPLITLPEVTGP